MRRTKALILVATLAVLTSVAGCSWQAEPLPGESAQSESSLNTSESATQETAEEEQQISDLSGVPELSPEPAASFEPSPTPQPEPSPGPTPEPTPEPVSAATSVWDDVVPAAWGQAYGTITCDAIGLNASLIWGDDQSLLNQRGGVYQYPGSYQVGVTGGHLLCSHNDSVFSLLQYVSIGDDFVVDTDYGEYVYSVTLAMPGYVSSDASTVIADDGTVLVNFTDGIDKLIMYTCYPFGYYSPTNQRYVVQAVLRA